MLVRANFPSLKPFELIFKDTYQTFPYFLLNLVVCFRVLYLKAYLLATACIEHFARKCKDFTLNNGKTLMLIIGHIMG